MACKQEDFYVAYDHCIECARKEICRMCGLWADTNKELITVKNERDLLLAMPEGWEWRRPGAIGWCAFNEFGEYSGCSTPDTGDKARDLWRLVVLCRLAAKEKTR